MSYSYFDYERNLMNLLESVKMQILARPLVLGGVAGSGGGTGGPPGGFIGWLPQSRITYDTDEAATMFTVSGTESLVDNLNHIRYRVTVLEDSILTPTTLTVQQNGVTIASDVTVLNFANADITEISPGNVLVICGSGITDTHEGFYNETLSGTNSFTTSYEFIPNSLRVYFNGVRQKNSYFTPGIDNQSFTTTFEVGEDDEIFVDYDIVSSGALTGINVTVSGGGSGDTSATYVVGSESSSLSNEIVIPSFLYNAEVPGTFGSFHSEEFNTTDLTGWAWGSDLFGAYEGQSVDSNITIPHHMVIRDNTGSLFKYYTKPINIGTDFDIRFLMTGAVISGAINAGLRFAAVAGNTGLSELTEIVYTWNTSSYYRITSSYNDGSSTALGTLYYVNPDRLWYRFYGKDGYLLHQLSRDGYSWAEVGQGTRTIDVQQVGFGLCSGSTSCVVGIYCDCIRIEIP